MDGSVSRHCRHCWGNCAGECLLPGGSGQCIHRPRRLPGRLRLQLLVNGRFWRRVFYGVR